MELYFHGSRTGELFSKEMKVSLNAVIDRLLITDPTSPNRGFLSACLPGAFFAGTMWTRDSGAFLRELVLWGRIEEAKLLTEALIRSVSVNEKGFRMFAERYREGEIGCGKELDGTAAILIAISLLFRALPNGDTTKETIRTFLTDKTSPVFGILNEMDGRPLLIGSGEFGGGCGVGGEHSNITQNNLIHLALLASALVYDQISEGQTAALCRQGAKKLSKNILSHLVDEEGKWIWCIDPETLKPNPVILNAEVNKGCGLLNAPLAMAADIYGLSLHTSFYGYEASVRQFDALYHTPPRYDLFNTYGVWTQFDDMRPGSTGASFGQGYALQCMLLMRRMDMADKALIYLTHETYSPIPEFKIHRDSPYYFMERYYCPYTVEVGGELEAGEGALNVVSVAEPLKIGRMMAGFDNSGVTPVISPLLPSILDGYEAEDVPLLCHDNLYLADVVCTRDEERLTLSLSVKNGILPCLTVRGERMTKTLRNIRQITLTLT